MHEDEIALADDAARALVADQFPQWRDAAVRRVASGGTVNAVFRVGDALATRFPLRGADAAETQQVLESEARASAEFAAVLPFPSPVPVGLGQVWPGLAAAVDGADLAARRRRGRHEWQ